MPVSALGELIRTISRISKEHPGAVVFSWTPGGRALIAEAIAAEEVLAQVHAVFPREAERDAVVEEIESLVSGSGITWRAAWRRVLAQGGPRRSTTQAPPSTNA